MGEAVGLSVVGLAVGERLVGKVVGATLGGGMTSVPPKQPRLPPVGSACTHS